MSNSNLNKRKGQKLNENVLNNPLSGGDEQAEPYYIVEKIVDKRIARG